MEKNDKTKLTTEKEKNSLSKKNETKTKKIEETDLKKEEKKVAPKKNNIKLEKESKKEIIGENKKEKVSIKKSKEEDKKIVSVSDKNREKGEKTITELFLETEKMNIIKKEKESKKHEFYTLEVVVLVLLTCIISLTVGGLLGNKYGKKRIASGELTPINDNIQQFITNYNDLINNYYGDINEEELLNIAFKSILNSLDDNYSGVIDDNVSNNFDIELEGKYEGLGIEISNDENKNIYIYRVIPNSPASKVDIQVGDKLLTVNDISVSGMTTTEFINTVVKGTGAKKFSIVLERNGEQKNVEILKEKIVLQSVTSKTYEENGKMIGYLKVSIFANNTYEQFRNELNNLEKLGIDSLIIDLRDNSGGHLTAVRDMISLFLDSSHIIYQTQDRYQKTEKTYSSGSNTKKYPIVILGNTYSASASEVMIGALTEEYGAVLIGNKTFGKGTVQELRELSNGVEYKFTTKKWLTPKGVWVHNNGIKPKIEVTLSTDYYENPIEENDNQLKTALDYLKGINK